MTTDFKLKSFKVLRKDHENCRAQVVGWGGGDGIANEFLAKEKVKDSTHKERRGRVAMIEFVAIYLC